MGGGRRLLRVFGGEDGSRPVPRVGTTLKAAWGRALALMARAQLAAR
jgi:hypothetical protein